MRLKNKIALITGATSGIGRAIAMEYAREGASVAIVGRNHERLQEVKEAIEQMQASVLAIKADLTLIANIAKVVKDTCNHFGTLDILVNSAGIFQIVDFFNVDEACYELTMTTNLKTTFFLSQKAAMVMKECGKGKIINIASQAGGVVGFPRGTVYCASKGGVVSLTQSMAVELAPYHINVNAISPGTIKTPINAKLFREYPEFLQDEISSTPWGRLGETGDIAPAAVFLASDESDFITGVQIIIDGGFSAQ